MLVTMPEDRTLERTTYVPETDTPDDLQYAGFWRRVGASFVDQGIIALPWLLVFFLARDWSFATRATTGFLVSLAVALGYWAGMESSRWQATLGKRAFGLVVTGLDAERLAFPRAAWRTIGKWLSCLTLGLGFAAAGWTRRKQTLHDLLADTLVIRRGPRLPTEALGLPVAIGILLSSVSSAVVLPYMEPRRPGAGPHSCPSGSIPVEEARGRVMRGFPLPDRFTIAEASELHIELTAAAEPGVAARVLRQQLSDAGLRISDRAMGARERVSYPDQAGVGFFFKGPSFGVWQVSAAPCASGTVIFLDGLSPV